MRRRAVAALCVGGADALMRAAAVLCAVACGVVCALCAGEEKEEEGRKRVRRRGNKDSPLSYLFTLEEIVGARFAAHDLVTDGELRPHDLRHDLLCGLTAARSATPWATKE